MLMQKQKSQKNRANSPHLIKRPFKNHEYREQRTHKGTNKMKTESENTGKGSMERQMVMSQKKNNKEKKTPKISNLFDRPENQSFFDLEHHYNKEINEEGKQVKWFVPQEQLTQHGFSTFPEFIEEEHFENLNNFKLNFLHFVCKRRVIKDQDFEFIYEGMLMKFPHREEEIKVIMAEVLAVLDS